MRTTRQRYLMKGLSLAPNGMLPIVTEALREVDIDPMNRHIMIQYHLKNLSLDKNLRE